MTNQEKALVEKLEQEINNDLDMNVETEQFISTDTYVGQTELNDSYKVSFDTEDAIALLRDYIMDYDQE